MSRLVLVEEVGVKKSSGVIPDTVKIEAMARVKSREEDIPTAVLRVYKEQGKKEPSARSIGTIYGLWLKRIQDKLDAGDAEITGWCKKLGLVRTEKDDAPPERKIKIKAAV
jgi:hypothetical protein